MNKKANNNQITNFYEQLPKSMIKKIKNDNYGKTHWFKLPMRCAIVGSSGCFLAGTKIRMADDSVKLIEDITLEDKVMGDDLKPRNLLRLCRGREKMYCVSQYKERSLSHMYKLKPVSQYVVNASHILCLKNFKTGEIIEKTAEEVYDNDLVYQYEFGGYNAKHDYIYTIDLREYGRCHEPFDYYGFQCDGNERFCLEDYTVTHNSGKTNTMLNVLQKLGDVFHHLVICVKSIEEPLYKYLLDKIPDEKVEVHEDSVVDIKKFEEKKWKDKSICIIYDDLVTEKHLHQDITRAFIRGRKVAGGISMFFLSQSYYQIPKSIRLQCQIILKKIGSIKDLKEILKDHQINKSLNELQQIYEYATQDKFDFLLIDNESEPEEQLKKNFMEIIE